jgi:amidase
VGLAEELAELDGLGQAELVRRGELTARELVAAAIERIERLNPTLNAVVAPTFELGLEAAARVPPDLPFAGVPLLLKDLVATCAGVPHTEGSAFLRDYVAERDSELVSRLRRAGFCPVGVTNTAEFGIAAGMVPIAHGNDGGGSLRIPASCCGLFALKPTRGRNPLGPEFGDVYAGLVAEHALTRSVRDSAALLDATAGGAPGDPYPAPPPARPFLEEVGAEAGRLRVAVTVDAASGGAVQDLCANAVHDTASLCAQLGHDVAEAAPDVDGRALGQAWFDLWSDGNAWLVGYWARRVGRAPAQAELEPLTWALVELGRRRTAADHLHAVEIVQREARAVAAFFERWDVLLTPTLAQPPVELGALEPPAEDPLRWLELDASFAPFTALANATGQPAVSVPLAWTDTGLPLGSHFVGRFGDEATLLRLAAQLEAARPWAGRRPPVWAGSASPQSPR